MEELQIPPSVKYIGRDAIATCKSLTSLQIGKQWKLFGNRLFSFEDNHLQSLKLPSSLHQETPQLQWELRYQRFPMKFLLQKKVL